MLYVSVFHTYLVPDDLPKRSSELLTLNEASKEVKEKVDTELTRTPGENPR